MPIGKSARFLLVKEIESIACSTTGKKYVKICEQIDKWF
jgi:hypothetical protein